jgi:hypothetical protein
MKKVFLYSFLILAIITFTFGFEDVVHAIPCSAGSVTPSTSCTDGPSGDNNDSATDLNSGNYFSINNWEELQKWDVDPDVLTTTVDIGFDIEPKANVGEGTWSINASAWSIFEKLVITLKDGNTGPPGFIYWSAYLLTDDSTSGTWHTGGVFDEEKEEWSRALSHATIYGSRDDVPIPEPATMLLLGSGLIGLAGVGRKKFFKKS